MLPCIRFKTRWNICNFSKFVKFYKLCKVVKSVPPAICSHCHFAAKSVSASTLQRMMSAQGGHPLCFKAAKENQNDLFFPLKTYCSKASDVHDNTEAHYVAGIPPEIDRIITSLVGANRTRRAVPRLYGNGNK